MGSKMPNMLPSEKFKAAQGRNLSTSRDSAPRAFHILEVELEGAGGDEEFSDREAERGNEQEQCHPEAEHSYGAQVNEGQEHRHHAQKQTADAQELHQSCEVQPLAQVADLRSRDLRAPGDILVLEFAHERGV